LPVQSDIDLWNAFTRGEVSAYETLFRRYYPLLFQFGMKIIPDTVVVEESIQELFIELWQKKTETPQVSVKAYLLKATRYKIYKHFRMRRPMDEFTEERSDAFDLPHEQTMIRQEEDDSRLDMMRSALDKLPARQKEVIYLKIYKGLSYEEVSEVMKINYQVVRNLLCQALKSFRKHCART
jgi:RNA polymerase sigma-70 factor (ECF subfamily)